MFVTYGWPTLSIGCFHWTGYTYWIASKDKWSTRRYLHNNTLEINKTLDIYYLLSICAISFEYQSRSLKYKFTFTIMKCVDNTICFGFRRNHDPHHNTCFQFSTSHMKRKHLDKRSWFYSAANMYEPNLMNRVKTYVCQSNS